MWAHPGQLLFMGGELAQEAEWSHERSLDWHLLEDPEHRGVQRWMRDLNRIYRAEPALWGGLTPAGFEWVDANDDDGNTLSSFLRIGPGTRPGARLRLQLQPRPKLRLPRRRALRRTLARGAQQRQRPTTAAAVWEPGRGRGHAGLARAAVLGRGAPCRRSGLVLRAPRGSS